MSKRKRTRAELDSERYTTAMLSLGYAYSLVLRMRGMLVDCRRLDVEADVDWLRKKVQRVMDLNEQAADAEGEHADTDPE